MPLATALGDVTTAARLCRRLPGHLRTPISPPEALRVVRARLESREEDFLVLARRVFEGHPPGPYRELLRLAGCELGDVERLVRKDGTESALQVLLRHGVYLATDEFKGRRPIQRGSATLAVDPHQLANPDAAGDVRGQTSGSRGRRTSVPLDLACIRDWAVNTCLDFEARGGRGWVQARWTVPGGEAIAGLLRYFLAFGHPAARWFSPVDPSAPEVHARYRWSARLLRWIGAASGVRFPPPEHVSPEDPRAILDWLVATLRAGQTPLLVAYASSAVRLARIALDLGLDLRGARFLTTGEPLTAARLGRIAAVGGQVAPSYASMDAGVIGTGCLQPAAADDVHVFHDLVAVIQPQPSGNGSAAPAPLFVTTLRPTTPLLLLNVALGDSAVLVARRCGCPLERLGWSSHLHTIRSFEKLTAGGMTFLDVDVIRVLEEVLPARFGGGPTDYQLVEEEDESGQAALRLLVDPGIGPADGPAIAAEFLSAIGRISQTAQIMGAVWRDSRLVRVERRRPFTTASGKILHLHVRPRTAARSADPSPAAS